MFVPTCNKRELTYGSVLLIYSRKFSLKKVLSPSSRPLSHSNKQYPWKESTRKLIKNQIGILYLPYVSTCVQSAVPHDITMIDVLSFLRHLYSNPQMVRWSTSWTVNYMCIKYEEWWAFPYIVVWIMMDNCAIFTLTRDHEILWFYENSFKNRFVFDIFIVCGSLQRVIYAAIRKRLVSFPGKMNAWFHQLIETKLKFLKRKLYPLVYLI